jgi:uncharacterized phage protein gp47/JayE
MSTPPYAPPSIGPAGLTVASYASILADNIQGFLNIYGVNQFVGPSSAIYQLLSLISLKQSDVNLAAQLAYNQTSPLTAVGAGLDRVVKMNGLARDPYSYSTATLTLTGTAGTIITNGFAQDVNSNLWAIPSPTILIGGTASVVATCTTPGNVVASPGQISLISSPITGWNTVTNSSAATPGSPVETDSKLRARQTISVALPSITALQSTLAAILAVSGVTRINTGSPTPAGGPGSSIENPTNATDSWGNPPHSISMVVEGGTNAAVAQAIYGARSIGCLTHGTTSVVVTDPNTGYVMTISFYRPTYVSVYVYMVLSGYPGTPTTTTIAAVKAAVVVYLNTLQIGETVSIAAVNYAIMAVNLNLGMPTFGVKALYISGSAFAAGYGVSVSGVASITYTPEFGTAAIGMNIDAVGTTSGLSLFPPGTTITGFTTGVILTSANALVSDSSDQIICYTTASAPTGDVAMPNFYDVSQGLLANVGVSTI